VIIPVRDGERFIGDAIASALAQGHRPVEVIVVDDGSTDGTAEVAGLAGVTVLRQAGAGHAAAKNAGAAAATGDLVAFLDADDVWLPTKLAAQTAALDAAPKAGFSVCHMVNVFEDGSAEHLSAAQLDRLTDQVEGWLPSALLVRRWAWDAIGPFDPTLPHGNDTDWFARAREVGIGGAVVPQVLLHRRIHGSNATHRVKEIHDDLLRAVRASLQRRRRI
jgi:glycosyltransferase involved in cell wall biosynthesis